MKFVGFEICNKTRTLAAAACIVLAGCARGQDDDFIIETIYKVPTINVGRNVASDAMVKKKYTVAVRSDVPYEEVALIDSAMNVWSLTTSGKMAYEMMIRDDIPSNVDDPPNEDNTITMYVDPNVPEQSPAENAIGLAHAWRYNGDVPSRARIWIKSGMRHRTFYLTAVHEIGHALGLPHSDGSAASIMFATVTDVGDLPTHYDKQNVCALWGCKAY